MDTVKSRIEDIKRNSYSIDFGTVFNQAFENYKKIALYAGSAILIFSVIAAVVALGTIIALFGITQLKEMADPENMIVENLSGINLALYAGLLITLSCLLTPFFAGFIKMAHAAQQDEEFQLRTLFSYYKNPYFKDLVLATGLITIVTTLLSTVFREINMEFIGGLLNLVINFLTILLVPFVIFGNLNAIEAIKASFTVIIKQPVVILALVITAYVGSFVGFVGCCIGVFFTLPFLYSMLYAIYSSIIGFENGEINL
jgi:uncharacterized membrane protein